MSINLSANLRKSFEKALEGAEKTLKKTKRVVLEYHSDELRKKCLEMLSQNGFESLEKGSLIFSWKNKIFS